MNKKPGRPATGRTRSKKLHLWISENAANLLARYCAAYGKTKTMAIEFALERLYKHIVAAEQDER